MRSLTAAIQSMRGGTRSPVNLFGFPAARPAPALPLGVPAATPAPPQANAATSLAALLGQGGGIAAPISTAPMSEAPTALTMTRAGNFLGQGNTPVY